MRFPSRCSITKRFSKLNRTNIRSTTPGQSITEYGITFAREPNGDGVYSVNFMVDRQRIHRVIGRESEGVTRRQAEDFVTLARADARRGRLDLPEARKTPLGFGEAAWRYVDELEHEGGRNVAAKRRQLDQHLTPFFRQRPLSRLSSSEIEWFKKKRRSEGAAPATVMPPMGDNVEDTGRAVRGRFRGFQRAKIRLALIIKNNPQGNGGQGGIRTLGTLLTFTHFPGVRLQPLGHLSASHGVLP